MTDFSRKLNLAALSPTSGVPGWFRDMVRLTRPAGVESEQTYWTAPKDGRSESGDRPMTLRVSIRNGYVNFYCAGQSVGKVWFGKTLRGEVHYKYLHDKEIPGKDYVGLATVETDYPEHGRLEKWISRTYKHQGVEKLFVDKVYGANRSLIDLEAALPGFTPLDAENQPMRSKKTGKVMVVAPRMDIVGLEAFGDGWKLVFWEAKTTARILKSTTPVVIDQLTKYRTWLASKTTETLFCDAYYDTCIALIAINDWAKSLGLLSGEVDPVVRSIASDRSRLVGLDKDVRLLVDNREGGVNFCDEHLPKLADANIPIHVVNEGMTFALPTKAAMPRTPICK